MSNQLQKLLKEFEQNASLTGILERRRRVEERLQYELKGSEGIDAMNRNLAPPFRAGLAGAATSAAVADALARNRVAVRVEAAVARRRAADVLAAQQANNQPGEIPVGEGLAFQPLGLQSSISMPATPAGQPATPGGQRRRRAPETPRNINRSESRGRNNCRGSASRGSGYSPTEPAMSEVE